MYGFVKTLTGSFICVYWHLSYFGDEQTKLLLARCTQLVFFHYFVQATRSRPDYSHSDVEVKANVGYGPLAPTGAESIVSAEAYRRRHEISVTVSFYFISAAMLFFFCISYFLQIL